MDASKMNVAELYDEVLQMAQFAGMMNDSHIQGALKFGVSSNPETAAKLLKIAQARLASKVREIQLKGPPPTPLQKVPANEAFELGRQVGTGFPVLLRWTEIFRNLLIVGPNGSGKTTLLLWFCLQLLLKVVKVELIDRKSEAPRIIPHLPKNIRVLRCKLNEWPDNFLKCPSEAQAIAFYSGVMSHLSQVQPYFNDATARRCLNVIARMLKSRRPGDPWPSFKDIEYALSDQARIERDRTLDTGARAFESISIVLGDNAFIRKCPVDVEEMFDFIVFDVSGVDRNIVNFLSVVRALYRQMHMVEFGKPKHPRFVVDDEGRPLLMADITERCLAESRSARLGFGFGLQSTVGVPVEKLELMNTLIALRPNDYEQARVMARRLLLPEDTGARQLLSLTENPRQCYIRMPGVPAPILAEIPQLPF